jgi:hypothetical protein
VFIAAIGAAAVLGGVVGGLLRLRIEAASSPSPQRWWCSTNVCTRERETCEALVPVGDSHARMDCRATRIAFCPLYESGGLHLQCVETEALCAMRAHSEGDAAAYCVGVE